MISAPFPTGGQVVSAIQPGGSAAMAAAAASAKLGSAAAIPLGELLRRVGAAVKSGLPNEVWIVAAVAAAKPASGGHTVELVEPDVPRPQAGLLRAFVQIRILESLRQGVGHPVEVVDLVGMTVTLRVTLELHPRWGLSARVLAFGPGLEQSLAKLVLEAAIGRLRRDGLIDRQQRLPVPRDVTRIAVVHPVGAAGWGDVAGELLRWQAAGLLVVRSLPCAFEGPGAVAGIAAALGRAAEDVAGSRPDLLLVVRGGGAASSLAPFDDECLARAVATSPVPVVTGLGHSVNRTLADSVAWRACHTPSKALTFVLELMAAPARRARADHAAVLAAASAAVAGASPTLAALERLATATALRQVVAASQRLDHDWGTVREAAESTRGRLARGVDRLDRMAADIVEAAPVLVGRTSAELAALMEAVRARARRASQGADDGSRTLAIVAERAASLVDTAGADLVALAVTIETAAASHLDRTSAGLDEFARSVGERCHQRVGRADDGASALADVKAAIAETLRFQDVAIARLHETVETAVERRIDVAALALERALATLDAADPVQVLRLGYALVMDGQNRVVTSAAAARTAATTLTLTFADGAVAVRLASSQPNGDKS